MGIPVFAIAEPHSRAVQGIQKSAASPSVTMVRLKVFRFSSF
jgi:hypothetical protein